MRKPCGLEREGRRERNLPAPTHQCCGSHRIVFSTLPEDDPEDFEEADSRNDELVRV